MFSVKVESGDLARLSRQLRTVGDAKAIRRDLVRGLRSGAKPALEAVRAAALALPDNPGGRSTGLRRKAARAASIQVRTSGRQAGVYVRISRARMGNQAGALKGSRSRRWRHPVFGNRDVWVQQASRPEWFDRAARSQAGPARRAVQQVLNDIERRMAHR